MPKEKVILDPHFRKLTTIFTKADLARMGEMADLIWARDEPMPDHDVAQAQAEVAAIITTGWRYGDVARFPKLEAVLEGLRAHQESEREPVAP